MKELGPTYCQYLAWKSIFIQINFKKKAMIVSKEMPCIQQQISANSDIEIAKAFTP